MKIIEKANGKYLIALQNVMNKLHVILIFFATGYICKKQEK